LKRLYKKFNTKILTKIVICNTNTKYFLLYRR